MKTEANQQNEEVPSAEEIIRLAEQLNSFANSTEYLDYFFIKLDAYVKNAEASRMHKLGTLTVSNE